MASRWPDELRLNGSPEQIAVNEDFRKELHACVDAIIDLINEDDIEGAMDGFSTLNHVAAGNFLELMDIYRQRQQHLRSN